MYSRFVFYHFQHVAGASFDATPATGATACNNADNPVPVFLLPVQVEGYPQENSNACLNI
jgi:hypothetical protein